MFFLASHSKNKWKKAAGNIIKGGRGYGDWLSGSPKNIPTIPRPYCIGRKNKITFSANCFS